MSETDREELLRTARTHQNKALRFEDRFENGELATRIVTYTEKFGWLECRRESYWIDGTTNDEVEAAISECDRVQLIDLDDIPGEVALS